MSDTFTSVLECRLQETGGNSDTWGTKLNDEAIQYLEDKICDITTINTTGGDTTITASQGRANILKVTGTLASNAVIIVPNEAHSWYVWNATTDGGFAVTVKTASGTGANVATIPTDTIKKVFCHADDSVKRADDERIGEIFWIGSSALADPKGCFRMPTNNTPVSRTGIYREIFRLYSTGYGAGDGSTTFSRPFWLAEPISGLFGYMRL